jgi:ligand-binding sensor domain-containing protein
LHKMSTLEKKNKTLQKRIERLKKNNKLSIWTKHPRKIMLMLKAWILRKEL